MDSPRRHRRSIRLKGYDYRQPGAYFVTICTHRWQSLFGEVIDGEMVLNPVGRIVEKEWLKAAVVRSNVTLDEFVIMPNHLHGIIVMGDSNVGATCQVAPTRAHSVIRASDTKRAKGPKAGSLGAIIGQFKRTATMRINRLRGTRRKPVWQRNYYEHVIRSDESLNRIRAYIHYNPARWDLDKYNPHADE